MYNFFKTSASNSERERSGLVSGVRFIWTQVLHRSVPMHLGKAQKSFFSGLTTKMGLKAGH